jgi:phosphoribosylformylglycinamidine cyclo-ligase
MQNSENKPDTYTQDGVNKDTGNSISKIAYQKGRESFNNSLAVKIIDRSRGNFRGLRGWVINPDFIIEVLEARLGDHDKAVLAARDIYQTGGKDGPGTKPILTDAADMHRYAFVDAVAMVSADQSRYGSLPILYMNILDVSTLGESGSELFNKFAEMFEGLAEIAKEQRFVIYNGETAELGPCVSSDNLDAQAKYIISSTMIGINHPLMEITGEKMKPGNSILAIWEPGIRANGVSTYRKVLKMTNEEHTNADGKLHYNKVDKEFLKELAAPSILSDLFLAKMNGWYPKEYAGKCYPLGVAHISGGGIIEKFGDDLILQNGLSAELTHLYQIPTSMRTCAELRRFKDDEEFYSTLNGGHGVLIVVEEGHVDEYIQQGKEHGLEIQEIGKVIETPQGEQPTLTIHSMLNQGVVIKHVKK